MCLSTRKRNDKNIRSFLALRQIIILNRILCYGVMNGYNWMKFVLLSGKRRYLMFPTRQHLTFLIIIFRSCTLEKLSLQHLLLTVEILLKEPSLAMAEVSSKVKTRKSKKFYWKVFGCCKIAKKCICNLIFFQSISSTIMQNISQRFPDRTLKLSSSVHPQYHW